MGGILVVKAQDLPLHQEMAQSFVTLGHRSQVMEGIENHVVSLEFGNLGRTKILAFLKLFS